MARKRDIERKLKKRANGSCVKAEVAAIENLSKSEDAMDEVIQQLGELNKKLKPLRKINTKDLPRIPAFHLLVMEK